MVCKFGTKECDGCCKCEDVTPVLYDDDDEPIYEGDAYYEIDGTIYSEKTMEYYRKLA